LSERIARAGPQKTEAEVLAERRSGPRARP
jgi:hypothetical protein